MFTQMETISGNIRAVYKFLDVWNGASSFGSGLK